MSRQLARAGETAHSEPANRPSIDKTGARRGPGSELRTVHNSLITGSMFRRRRDQFQKSINSARPTFRGRNVAVVSGDVRGMWKMLIPVLTPVLGGESGAEGGVLMVGARAGVTSDSSNT